MIRPLSDFLKEQAEKVKRKTAPNRGAVFIPLIFSEKEVFQ